MAITMRCTNPDCGRVFTLSDDAAQRGGTCPACGAQLAADGFGQGPGMPPPPRPPQPPPGFTPQGGFQPGWAPMPTPPPPPMLRPPESLEIGVGSVIAEAWHIVKADWGQFMGVFFVYFIIISLMGAVPFLGGVAQLILTAPFLCGMQLFCLKKARGEHAVVSDLFKGFHFFGRALGAYWLTALLTGAAFLALIIPGIIVALGFSLTYFFIIDTPLGVWDSMKSSWNILKGYKWKLFLIMLVCGLINILGLLCLFVGLLVTIPIGMMAVACVYHRLRTAEMMTLQPQAAPAAQWTPPPPPGGFAR